MLFVRQLAVGLIISSVSSFAFAKSTLSNTTDESITIRSLGILPCTDNTNNVYCRYVEKKLKTLISEGHRFGLVELKDTNPELTIENYEKQAVLARNISQKNNADGLVIALVTKTEKTIGIRLDLYLGTDGLLFSTEQIDNESKFEVSDVEKKVEELYERLISKIPYKGLVLSRQGQRVTIDLGINDGIKNNDVLTVEQIIEIKRHPKFNFILSSEKEIIGRIKVIKAEARLSFATILQEKERGAVAKNSKLSGIGFINYQDLPTVSAAPSNIPKDEVSFGKNPRDWKPDTEPVLGFVGVGVGLGNTKYSTTYLTAGSFIGENSLYPQIDIHGEIWFTKNWGLGAALRQGIYSMGNSRNGSVPGSLGANSGHYDFHLAYKFLIQDEFWGPQIEVMGGFMRYSLFVDASTPLTLASQVYSGLYLGIAGHVPVDEERRYMFDAELKRVLLPGMTETPTANGGGSDNSITTIGLGGSYKLNTQFRLKFMLNFEFYSTSYTGMGTRVDGDQGLNASQSLNTLIGGLDYFF